MNALKSDLGFVVCFGYKWGFEKKAHCITARKKDLQTFSDKWILKKASKLLTDADLTVAHYGSVFDRRFFQGRLLINRLKPIPATKMRDTCMIARSVANFSSNRLGHLSKILKLKQQKMEKGDGWPNWWFQTMQGDMSSLNAMAKYCVQDVLALEALYKRLLPFDSPHPDLHQGTPWAPHPPCGTCGGETLWRGVLILKHLRYRRFQCKKCGRWGHERRAVK